MSTSETQASTAPLAGAPVSTKAQSSPLIAPAPTTFPNPAVTGKWSGRKTLVFVLGASALAWAVIIWGALYLF